MATTPLPYTPKNHVTETYIEVNGLKFRTHNWAVPEGVAYKARVLVVHGFAEHVGLYTRLGDQLCGDGFECFIFDQRGAGLTSPGDQRGITTQALCYSDLDHMIGLNLKTLPENKGLFLLGHSMGSGILLNYGIEGIFRDRIAGIVAIGPLVTNHPKSKPNAALKFALLQVCKVLPNYRFKAALAIDNILGDSPQWKQYMKDDPLCTPVGSLRLFNDMLLRGEKLLDPVYAGKFRKELPLLITYGEEDYINDLKGAEAFFAVCGATDKTLATYKKGRHSLYIEGDAVYLQWYADVKAFLNSHLDTVAA